MSPALEFTGTYDAAQRNFDALAAAQPVTVTSLPTSASDGQEIYYVADSTNGIKWRLQYNAGSSSPYKWSFGGGDDVVVQDLAGRSLAVAAATWTQINAADPSYTAPLSGEYAVEFGSNVASSTVGEISVGLSVAGVNPANSQGGDFWPTGLGINPGGYWNTSGPGRRIVTLAVGQVVAMRFRHSAAATVVRGAPTMRIHPRRVG